MRTCRPYDRKFANRCTKTEKSAKPNKEGGDMNDQDHNHHLVHIFHSFDVDVDSNETKKVNATEREYQAAAFVYLLLTHKR